MVDHQTATNIGERLAGMSTTKEEHDDDTSHDGRSGSRTREATRGAGVAADGAGARRVAGRAHGAELPRRVPAAGAAVPAARATRGVRGLRGGELDRVCR